MKLFFKILFGLVIFLFTAFICLIIFTNNPTKEYIQSEWFGMKTQSKILKGKKINLNQLDSIIKSNPNSIFDIFTYYCGPCQAAIKEGSDYDSISLKSRFYISIDNTTTIDKLSILFDKNKRITQFYYIEDSGLKGAHFGRGDFIFKKYFPNSTQSIGYPLYFYTNEKGIIDSFSLGYASKH